MKIELDEKTIDNIVDYAINNPSKIDFALELQKLEMEINGKLNKFKNIEEKKKDTAEFPDESTPKEGPDYLFKIIVVGDPGVGKTAITVRYTDSTFTRSYIATIGVNLSIK